MLRADRTTCLIASVSVCQRLLLLNLLMALAMQLLGLLPQWLQRPSMPMPTVEADFAEPLSEQLGRLPLVFEPSALPIGPAQFQARALGGTLFFAPAELLLARPDTATLRVRFLSGNPAAQIEAVDPLPTRVNRFLGDDPAHWQSSLPTSAALVYRRLYPGIDLRYDGMSRRLKGTYLVEPGAKPASIRWRYDGAQEVRLSPDGDLLIGLAANQRSGATQILTERAPVAWQDTEGGRVSVDVLYNLAADGSVGFRLGHYDPHLPLVIDPTLEFSSYLGGSGNDHISDVVFDSQGNIYVVGDTYSTDFPLAVGAVQPQSGGGRDVVVLKLSPTGTTLLFSTYLGGDGDEYDPRVLVDGQSIVVLGTTQSSNFPTKPQSGPNGGIEMFVSRLSADGSAFAWSRYLGGDDEDTLSDAVLDAQGRVTLVGTTRSANFPTGQGLVYQPDMPSPPRHSPVVAQLSPDGATITFRTFLSGAQHAIGKGLALSPDGSIVLTGLAGDEFPLGNNAPRLGGSDVFIAKLTPGATSLVFSIFLGGRNEDGPRDLAVDSSGAIYVIGNTRSGNFPGRNLPSDPSDTDGFLVKFSPDGQTQLFSQLQTGDAEEDIRRITLDAQGNLYLLGISTSTNITPINPLIQPDGEPAPLNGNANILLLKLSADGATIQSRSLLGGSGTDEAWALAVTPAGRVALGGFTYSPDLPQRNALQNRPNPQQPIDALLMIIDTTPLLKLTGVSNPAVLPDCPTDPCASGDVTWTLEVPYRLDTTLTITLPEKLDVLPGSVSGATLSGRTLRSNDSVQPGSPKRVRYKVRASKDLVPGSILTTLAHVSTPGGLAIERNLMQVLPNPLAPGQHRTLVLIYASGDNDLRDAMLLLANNAERGAATADVVALLVLDGPGSDDAYLYKLQSPQDGPDCIGRLRDPSCAKRYVLDKTFQKWPDNLASPDTLTDFLVSAQQAFPATRRVLSLVGHGGGWGPNVLDGQPSRHGGQPSRHGGQNGENLGGMLWDDNPVASLSTAELARALTVSQRLIGSRFDLLFLDACNMGQIEVAYELRESAHFLLASPNWKWAAFPYDQHLADATIGDGAAIGKAWLANEEQALAEHIDEPYTYILLDLSRLEELRQRVNTLADSLKGQPEAPVRAAFRLADRYDGNQDGLLDERDTTIDLGSFAARLAVDVSLLSTARVADAAKQVRQALKSAVVQQSAVVQYSARGGSPWLFHRNTWQWSSDAQGLAIYLPLGAQDDWRRRYYRSLAFGKGSAWADLIDRYWGNAAAPGDPVCGRPCNPPVGPPLRPVFLPLVRR